MMTSKLERNFQAKCRITEEKEDRSVRDDRILVAMPWLEDDEPGCRMRHEENKNSSHHAHTGRTIAERVAGTTAIASKKRGRPRYASRINSEDHHREQEDDCLERLLVTTATINEFNGSESERSRSINPKRRKRCSFGKVPKVETIETLSRMDISPDEWRDTWFSRDEFLFFKKEAREKAREIRDHHSRFVSSLERSSELTQQMSQELTEYDLADQNTHVSKLRTPQFVSNRLRVYQMWIEYESICILNTLLVSSHNLLIQGLTEWAKQSDFRGLERWASIKLRQSGEETCDSARHVVRISKLLNEKDFCERYRAVSRASGVFASLMGTADALAIQRAEQKQEQLSKIQHIGSIEKMSCFISSRKAFSHYPRSNTLGP